MTAYRNFVSDFPGRCGKLLDEFADDARINDLDVTLMLCVAMPSIVVALERLKGPTFEPGNRTHGHPSRDWERYKKAQQQLAQLCDEHFLSSRLWTDHNSTWYFDELDDVTGDPDSWLSDRKPLGPKKQAGTILKHLRNALSHGNIFTCGNPIKQIVFLAERNVGTNKFNYLAVTPAGFRQVLQNWLTFLKEIELPVDVIGASQEAAA